MRYVVTLMDYALLVQLRRCDMNKATIQDRIDKINKLYDGHTIVYLTAKEWVGIKIMQTCKEEFYEFTEIQLSLWGCKYHQLFLGKPSGDYYIDDKGYTP